MNLGNGSLTYCSSTDEEVVDANEIKATTEMVTEK